MGRNIRTTLPMLSKQRIRNLPNTHQLREKEKEKEKATKFRQKRNFDNRHCAKTLLPLNSDSCVYIPDKIQKEFFMIQLVQYPTQSPPQTVR